MNPQQSEWLTCNCAATPPTMPTCRADHLRTCPMWLYSVVCKMEAEHEDYRAKAKPGPVFHGRQMPNVEAVAMASAVVTLRVIRGLMEGMPIGPETKPGGNEGKS